MEVAVTKIGVIPAMTLHFVRKGTKIVLEKGADVVACSTCKDENA